MYQGAWVYPGLKPGYHSSEMNSSTGMTVAIASPRAGRAPLSRRFHCGFTLATGAFPSTERAGVRHGTGLAREPTMLSQEKAGRDQRAAGQSRAGTPEGVAP